MFTGIIQTVGTVARVTPKGGDVELMIDAAKLDLSTVGIGDSIACNGCCLTVTQLAGAFFCADVSLESLNVTTLKAWQVGTEVNIETALRAGDALGGHYVSGHVDGIGKVVAMHDDGRSLRMDFEISVKLGRYVARKGSICVDGVSLTVNGVGDDDNTTRFDVNLIPHTRAHTVIRNYELGTQVNIEIDMIARYLERMRTANVSDE
jgi:riboflavin synthase